MKKLIILSFSMLFCVQIFSQCFTDRHSRELSDGWVSCQMSESPNPIRGNSHWVMYDFGDDYTYGVMHLWNTNNPDALDNGMNEIVIDYSQDGVTWTEWGTFEIPRADGSGFYEGVEGPDLSGVHAPYMLITGLSNHGGPCFGLSEVRIATEGISVSNEDIVFEVAVDVFPNPTTDYTTISAEFNDLNEMPFTVIDMSGKLMKTGTVISKTPLTMNTSNWPAGQYQILIGPKGKESQKSLTILRE